MTTVEAHSCLFNMHVTFDLAEIEELMPQQARKQLEAELEKSCCSLGGVGLHGDHAAGLHGDHVGLHGDNAAGLHGDHVGLRGDRKRF